MIEDPKALIILDAITLRGIGSYLHGARLDIKPLTILCGGNGSGKSTWLKALNILHEALAANRLPYGFAFADWSPQDIQLTNAFYHLADPGNFESLEDSTKTGEFGSPGTIGLEVHASQSHFLSGYDDAGNYDRGSAWDFLHRGRCTSNTRIRLRFAHPTYWDDSSETPELRHVVELVFDGCHTIRMEGERDPLQKFEEGLTRPRRSKPYMLSCSLSFITGCDDDRDLTPIATIHDLIAPRFESLREEVDEKGVATLLELFEKRVRQLLAKTLDGYFYIGAIRQPHTSLKLSEARKDGIGSQQRHRYVGPAGESAWWFERHYGSATMRRIHEVQFHAADILPLACLPAFSPGVRQRSSKLSRVFERMAPSNRARIEELGSSLGKTHGENEQTFIADALNDLLNDRDLYEHLIWQEEHEYTNRAGDTIGMDVYIPDPDIDWLVQEGVDLLSDEKVRLLNFLLILDAFTDSPLAILPSTQQCTVDEYLSCWLKTLLDVDLNPTNPALSAKRLNQWTLSLSSLHARLSRPTPFLVSFDRDEDSSHGADANLSRLRHPCFGAGFWGSLQPPRQLSAGFHQVFPILMQLGLMRSGELLGIENPEVHLHPALQISLTEALLTHATSGRHLIVETHSDLVLRRVIRAILEEEIAQSQVQVYFASLQRTNTTPVGEYSAEFRSSSLEPIRVDEQGRIANWPAGFLDEDVRESQRLMDVMYGNQDSGEEDDDDEAS